MQKPPKAHLLSYRHDLYLVGIIVKQGIWCASGIPQNLQVFKIYKEKDKKSGIFFSATSCNWCRLSAVIKIHERLIPLWNRHEKQKCRMKMPLLKMSKLFRYMKKKTQNQAFLAPPRAIDGA